MGTSPISIDSADEAPEQCGDRDVRDSLAAASTIDVVSADATVNPCITGERENCYFIVTHEDVRRQLPDVLIFIQKYKAPMYFTPLFMLVTCLMFYATFNARDVKRQLCNLYAVQAPAEQISQ